MNNIYLVSFADMAMGITAYRFKQEAESSGAFKHVFVYNENSLPKEYLDKFGHLCYTSIETYKRLAKECKSEPFYSTKFSKGGKDLCDIDPRTIYKNSTIKKVPTFGFGMWSWKPYVILHTMSQLKENDILLYLDAGFRFSNNSEQRDEQLNEIVKNLEHYPVTTCSDGWTLQTICKRELFQFLGLDFEEHKNKDSVIAFLVAVKVCDESKRFVKEWLRVFEEAPNLVTDDIIIGDREYKQGEKTPRYKRSLHDQSILSCLAAKYNIKTFDIVDPKSRYKNSKMFKGDSKMWLNPYRDKHTMPLEIPEIQGFQDFLNSNIDNFIPYQRYKMTNTSQFFRIHYEREYTELSEMFGGVCVGCPDVIDEKIEGKDPFNKSGHISFLQGFKRSRGIQIIDINYEHLYDINYIIEVSFYDLCDGDVEAIINEECETHTALPAHIDKGSVMAEVDGQYVGVCLISELQPNILEVDRIAVLPQYRKKGVAKAMMIDTISRAFENDETHKIVIHHKIDNFPAIATSKSLGFVEVEVEKGYYKIGTLDALKLELTRENFNG